jgi:hypothetical protein
MSFTHTHRSRRATLETRGSDQPQSSPEHDVQVQDLPIAQKGLAIHTRTLGRVRPQGKIHYPKDPDGVPRLKQYLDEMPGVPLQSIWTDIRPLYNLAAERLGYPTQKPLALLDRIITASSNENDIVLDAFCGQPGAVKEWAKSILRAARRPNVSE